MFCLGLSGLLVGTPVVQAHRGGTPRIVNVDGGDFQLSVWTLPNPLVTGEANFIAYVAEASSQTESEFGRAPTPVLDANIEIFIEPIGSGTQIIVQPDHE